VLKYYNKHIWEAEMRKLFVTDLDGTLLENHRTITDDNYMYIQKLKDFNHCFAIATGRAYDHIELLTEKYEMDVDYFILLNGALIIDKHNNVIKHEIIPAATIGALISEFYNDDWNAYFSTGFKSFMFSDKQGEIPNPRSMVVKNLKDIMEEKISMLAMSYNKDDIKFVEDICRKINSKFGDVVVAYRNVNYIDIVPLGCSKGSGVEYIKEKEAISQKNTFAIGDSWNDVSMFKSVEHSFTFKAAEKELQTKARYIVDSVAECIGKYVIEDAS
jgi:Cof subfamily protein (haloacid dehalogenase superfamily)